MTQLELSSFAYVIYALFSYALQWYKPQSIEIPLTHRVTRSSTVRPVTNKDIRTLTEFGGSNFLQRNFVSPFGMDNRMADPTQAIPTGTSFSVFAVLFASDEVGALLLDDDLAGIVAGVALGALYCLGWKAILRR